MKIKKYNKSPSLIEQQSVECASARLHSENDLFHLWKKKRAVSHWRTNNQIMPAHAAQTWTNTFHFHLFSDGDFWEVFVGRSEFEAVHRQNIGAYICHDHSEVRFQLVTPRCSRLVPGGRLHFSGDEIWGRGVKSSWWRWFHAALAQVCFVVSR